MIGTNNYMEHYYTEKDMYNKESYLIVKSHMIYDSLGYCLNYSSVYIHSAWWKITWCED